MKLLVSIIFLFITTSISMISAGIINSGATLLGPREPGILVKGPSSKATVKGASGPIIVTAGDTGAVSAGGKSGGLVSTSGASPGVIASAIPLDSALVPIARVVPIEPIVPIAVPEFA